MSAKGIKAINTLLDKQKTDNSGPKVRWLTVADGQAVKIRFVEELDEDSSSFSPSRGLSVVIMEHVNPKEYKRKAVCTKESEGDCFGCEMAIKEPKTGWRARMRFYCNVLVDDGMEPPYIGVWSQGVSKQSAFIMIREYAEDNGGVSNLQWKLKRTGVKTETTYTLIPSGPDAEPFNWGTFEPYDLDKVVREIPYDEQEAFYLGFDSGSPSASSSNDW
jgi:hypothetical protein